MTPTNPIPKDAADRAAEKWAKITSMVRGFTGAPQPNSTMINELAHIIREELAKAQPAPAESTNILTVAGGLCYAHGPYAGQGCPRWPKCATEPQPFKPQAEPNEPRAWPPPPTSYSDDLGDGVREQSAKPQTEPSGEQSTQIEIENCTLEIDSFRGVIYVHSPEGFTTLRICGCPTPIPKPTPTAMLDITLKLGRKLFSWHPVVESPAPLRAQLEALLKQNRRLIERAEAAEAELAEAELADTRKAQEVHQLKLAKISGSWSRWPHIAPPTDVIEKNKETEPEGERLRAELADWLRHNQIVGILMDTKDHIVDIQIGRLPPRLKWVLRTWGAIMVVDDADESTLAELKDKEPTK